MRDDALVLKRRFQHPEDGATPWVQQRIRKSGPSTAGILNLAILSQTSDRSSAFALDSSPKVRRPTLTQADPHRIMDVRFIRLKTPVSPKFTKMTLEDSPRGWHTSTVGLVTLLSPSSIYRWSWIRQFQ